MKTPGKIEQIGSDELGDGGSSKHILWLVLDPLGDLCLTPTLEVPKSPISLREYVCDVKHHGSWFGEKPSPISVQKMGCLMATLPQSCAPATSWHMSKEPHLNKDDRRGQQSGWLHQRSRAILLRRSPFRLDIVDLSLALEPSDSSRCWDCWPSGTVVGSTLEKICKWHVRTKLHNEHLLVTRTRCDWSTGYSIVAICRICTLLA